jgi:tRNA threonylcarbamoyladenosine biosynthesis protein TsaB
VRVLGLDTATAVASVGICCNGRVLAERRSAGTNGRAADLPVLVAETLADAGLDVSDIDAVAISIGPGSFTGLRVGLGFAKGLAYARRLGLVGVSTLRALASAHLEDGAALVCLDARRGESYVGLYVRTAGGEIAERLGPCAMTLEAAGRLAEEVSDEGRTIVLGDGAFRRIEAFRAASLRGARLLSLQEAPPRGGVVARLGEERLIRGETEAIETLVPLYVRPAAAEAQRVSASLTTAKAL